jgi:hypothetical protein
VLDGIRRNASVGYVIHELVLEKQEGDLYTYRVTDWEPLEGSLVSIPADPSVGVGRTIDPATGPAKSKERTIHDHRRESEAGSRCRGRESARRDGGRRPARPQRRKP